MKKINNSLIIVAILSVFAIPMSTQIPTAGMQNIADHFPNAAYTTIAMVVTLPVLVAAAFSLVAGKIAGTKVETKSLIIFALILFTVGGVAPYFSPNNLTMILVWRAIYGIGVGLLSPLGATLVVQMLSGDLQTKAMGAGSIALNVSGVIYLALAGFLANAAWQNMFLIYFVGLLFLVAVILWLPREPIQTEKSDVVKDAKPAFITPAMVGIAVVCFVIAVLEYPVLINMSPLIINENIGTAATAGIILALYTVGGILGSAIYAAYKRQLKTHTIPSSMLIVAAGLLLISFGTNALMLGAGTLLIGVSFGIYYPEFYMLMGKAAPVSLTAMGMSLIMVGYDLGGFISPYFYSLLAQVTGQEGIRFPFIFSMIAFVVIAVIMGLGARKQPATENVKPDLAAEEKSTP